MPYTFNLMHFAQFHNKNSFLLYTAICTEENILYAIAVDMTNEEQLNLLVTEDLMYKY